MANTSLERSVVRVRYRRNGNHIPKVGKRLRYVDELRAPTSKQKTRIGAVGSRVVSEEWAGGVRRRSVVRMGDKTIGM